VYSASRIIGIIGLGHMGRAVARRLLAARNRVVVFNRTRNRADSLLQLGAAQASSAAQIAETADVIFTLVSDDAAIEHLAYDEDGFADRITVGKVLIDMSTLSEKTVEGISQRVRQAGGSMLHAPILGGPVDIYSGTATIVAGGAKAQYQKVLPLLEAISKQVHLVGELVHGTRMKMALNIMLTHYLMGTASSLAFAVRGGLPVPLVLDIMQRVASGVVQRTGDKMLSGETGVTFSIRNFEKDQRLFLDAARQLGVHLPTIDATEKLATEAMEKNMGDEDFTALFRLLLDRPQSA
jgi:3-hydroxyisobutyrate dehydrogenase